MENMDRAGDEFWMNEALAIADEGLALGELPIGAVVVLDDEIFGRTREGPRAVPRVPHSRYSRWDSP
jgi:tRNA(Arg) A34 adenosine deaminase TadA